MKATFRPAAAAASAASLAALSLLPAAPALASGGIPSDCTLTVTITGVGESETLTCTARPATQTWQIEATCDQGTHDVEAVGTKVTGDGTSKLACVGDIVPGSTVFIT
jgi:hypothetical protein